MDSQNTSSSPVSLEPSSSPPAATTTAPETKGIVAAANGTETVSDGESFHSGDEEFDMPLDEGKNVSLAPVDGELPSEKVGVEATGVGGDVDKVVDEGGGDEKDRVLGGEGGGGSETLVSQGDGAGDAARDEKVELESDGNPRSCDLGSAGAKDSVLDDAGPPVNSDASSEEEDAVVKEEEEVPVPEAVGGGDVVNSVEEKEDASGGCGEVVDDSKLSLLGGESSEARKYEGLQGESVAVVSEPSEGPASDVVGRSSSEAVRDSGPEKVEYFVEPEQVPLNFVAADGGESVEKKVETPASVADDSGAPGIDDLVQGNSNLDGHDIANADGAVEEEEDLDKVNDENGMASMQDSDNVDTGDEQKGDTNDVVAEAQERGLAEVAAAVDDGTVNSVSDSNQAEKPDDIIEGGGNDRGEAPNSDEFSKAVVSGNSEAVQSEKPDDSVEGGGDDQGEAPNSKEFCKAVVSGNSEAVQAEKPDDSIEGGGDDQGEAPNWDEFSKVAVSGNSEAVQAEKPYDSIGGGGDYQGEAPNSDGFSKAVVSGNSEAVQAEKPDDTIEGGGDDQGEAPNSDESSKVVVSGNSEAVKQLLKDLEGGGSSAASLGDGSSHDLSQEMDGQIVTDSDEEVDTDEEGGGKELFDSAALAALLRAATGASPDGNITISAPDAARIFSVDRPAGLGSSMPSLRPGPARVPRLVPPTSSDITVTGESENNMDEEDRALHEKVDQIRVKFLRLVHRLGHSAEDTVAAQVLYRLGLAEGIKRGRQTSRAFSTESAKRKALQFEENGEETLEFSCNILVLGKTGVGKSSIINSILGKHVAQTNAFQPSTTCVREISGMVDGVKIRFLDTPGLRPSIMDQNFNKKILSSIKKYTKKCPPDIVLYVDRLDTQTRDFNDLPLLRSIASALGSSIWFNAIVALTHAASAPPDGPNGTPLGYEVFVAQRSHVVQHSIRQAAGDMRLMNPVALVENHPSCRRNREGQRVLPNGTAWRPQLLLLCYSSKTLSEANSLLKLQDPSPGKLFGFRMRSPPLPYLLSSLLQSRAYPKLATDQGGDNGDSDVDLGDLSDSDQEEEEDEYDQLPPFKPLRKSQIVMLTKEQRKAYFDEYDYRVKLLQKKQWKEELRRLREMKKRGKVDRDDSAAYGGMVDDYDQDGAPAAVPVPLPDMVLPPSFDCNNPAYRYRFLEPTSQLLARPVLDTHGWDHDCGYDGVSLEENLAIVGQFPASVAVQITKDKKEFNVHLDSSVASKHGENGSSLAGFDIQSVGKQLSYVLRGETKFKNLKKNKTAAGVSVTFLGENIVTGVKVEDQVVIGKRVCLVGSTGVVRSQGDMAYGANLEARLREKDYPIGQDVTTLGLSLMKWRRDLALGANLQTQISTGRNSKMAVRVALNNKLTGQITVRTSTSDQLQIAFLSIVPIAVSIYRTIWPGESY